MERLLSNNLSGKALRNVSKASNKNLKDPGVYGQSSLPVLLSHLMKHLTKGGIAHIKSLSGGSKLQFALACIRHSQQNHAGAPPLSLWISDEGFIYPLLVHQRWKIPLSNFLLVKAPNAEEVWRQSLEASQSSLFTWILIRPSSPCRIATLRKLQLNSERFQCRVLLLCTFTMPHWPIKTTIHVPSTTQGQIDETNSLSRNPLSESGK